MPFHELIRPKTFIPYPSKSPTAKSSEKCLQKKEQRKSATTKSRQRISRSHWPALISSYEAVFDKIPWAKDDGIKSPNPYRLIKNWKDTLAKEEEELN